MSFLSRRSSSDKQRDGRAGSDARSWRDDSEYDDEFDDEFDSEYAGDGDDDSWSPDEYFSPQEDIRGRRAAPSRAPGRGAEDHDGAYGDGQGSRSVRGGHGRDGAPGRGEHGRGEHGRGEHGGRQDGHGRGEDRTEIYGLPGMRGSDAGETGETGEVRRAYGGQGEDERTDGRKRRERSERRRLLGRRDREEIWPDDGVSDEDYWASVATDRPLPGTGPAPGAEAAPGSPGQHGRPGPGAGPLHAEGRPAVNPRLGQRLGPPPGLAAPGPDSGPMTRAATGPGAIRPVASPTVMRPVSGPNAIRPAGSPNAARPSAGGSQTGPVSQGTSQASSARSSGPQPDITRHSGSQPGIAQPSFQPAASRAPARQPPAGRQPDRQDRDARYDRAERPDRPQAPAAHTGPRMSARNYQSPPPYGRGTDDDPLTSTAYSREAMAVTDTRSYRHTRNTGANTALGTEQTQAFSTAGQYPASTDPYAATARYPSYPQEQSAPPRGQQPPSAGGPPRGTQGGWPRPPEGRHPARAPHAGQAGYPARTAPNADTDPYAQPGRPPGANGYRASGPRPGGYGGATGYGAGEYGAGEYDAGRYGTDGYPAGRHGTSGQADAVGRHGSATAGGNPAGRGARSASAYGNYTGPGDGAPGTDYDDDPYGDGRHGNRRR